MRTPDTSRPLDLTGWVVLVTGGAGDTGSAVAAQAARLGATAVISDNGTSATGIGDAPETVTNVAKQLAAEHGSVVGHYCDVTHAEQVESMFEDLFAEHGNVDAVVAAGTLRVRPIWEASLDDWRSVLDSHATHTYLVVAACRRWRANSAHRAGSSCALVNFTAATGLVGRPDLGVTHSAAKGAIAGMTLELAQRDASLRVSGNAMAAANVRGRMADHVGARVSDGTTRSTRVPRPRGNPGGLPGERRRGVHHRAGLPGSGRADRPLQPLRADRVAQIGEILDDRRCPPGNAPVVRCHPEYKALQGRNRES